MLVPFLIMLREGLEAALIVGIVANYLHHTGRRALLPAVVLGILLALSVSLLAGAALQWAAAEFPQKQQELFEACVGLVAVGVLTAMVFWMRGAASAVKRGLESSVEHAVARGLGGWALVGMVFLAVAREGLESIFFLLAVFQQSQDWRAPVGALAGIAVSVALGWGLYVGGLRLNLRRFFRYTGIFVLVVAAGLLAGSLRKLHEAGIWNVGQQGLFDIGAWLPMDSPLGVVLSGVLGYQSAPVLSEAVVYVAYLLVALFLFLRPAKVKLVAPGTAAPAGMTAEPQAPPYGGGEAPALGPEFFTGGSAATVATRNWSVWIIGAALLVLASGAAFYAATGRAAKQPAPEAGSQVTITIEGNACLPNEVEVPAGLTAFTIINRTQRALEWEILDGVMVIDERENIAPGFTQTLRTRLKPGTFEMTCGLLSNPRGKLVVVPSEASRASAAKPELVQYVGMLAEYQVYQRMALRLAEREMAALKAAQAAGDSAAAWRHAATARAAYARLRPLAGRFGTTDQVLEPSVTGQQGFAGVMASLANGAGEDGDAAALPAIDAALAGLQAQLGSLDVTPGALVLDAVRFVRGQAEAAAEAQNWFGLQGAYDGTRRIAVLLMPLLADADPVRREALQQAFDAWGLQLCGAASCRELVLDVPDAQARQALAMRMRAAAEQLEAAAAALGLEGEP